MLTSFFSFTCTSALLLLSPYTTSIFLFYILFLHKIQQRIVSRFPREADPVERRTKYYRPQPSTHSDSRTFHIERQRKPKHVKHVPPPPPPPPSETFTPSPSYSSSYSPPAYIPPSSPTPTVYYFKPADSSPKPIASTAGQQSSSLDHFKDAPIDDNLAVPGTYNDPTYIIYPSSTPKSSSVSSTQSYLKPSKSPKQFHHVASYDAPGTASSVQSKSIYREETSKYHSGAILHQKVI